METKQYQLWVKEEDNEGTCHWIMKGFFATAADLANGRVRESYYSGVQDRPRMEWKFIKVDVCIESEDV